MLKKSDQSHTETKSVTIKKYANRRLYNTETSTYVTLDDLAEMVRADRDFTVYDAKTQEDLTHGVLTQIIVDQESKGQNMLPVPFLRQLIRYYDDSMSRLVPGYLQYSLEALAQDQESYREKLSQALTSPTGAIDIYQDQVRRNMEIFEKAMSMWSPFTGAPGETGERPPVVEVVSPGQSSAAATPPQTASKSELNELRSRLESMQNTIDRLTEDGGKEE